MGQGWQRKFNYIRGKILDFKEEGCRQVVVASLLRVAVLSLNFGLVCSGKSVSSGKNRVAVYVLIEYYELAVQLSQLGFTPVGCHSVGLCRPV